MGRRWEGMETYGQITVLGGHDMIMLANVRVVSDYVTDIIELSPCGPSSSQAAR